MHFQGKEETTFCTDTAYVTGNPEQARRPIQSEDDNDGKKIDIPKSVQHAKRNQPEVRGIMAKRGIMKSMLTITQFITGAQSCTSTENQ